MKKVLLLILTIFIIVYVVSGLIFSRLYLPKVALELTPENIHFSEGTTFSWILVQEEECKGLSDSQFDQLWVTFHRKYRGVYIDESDLPEEYIKKDKNGDWIGYSDGFKFSFSIEREGIFTTVVSHNDIVGNLAGSSGEHFYVWALWKWVKVYDYPYKVS